MPRAGSCTIDPMTVPGRVDAASLLLSLDPPAWFLRHARAVAEVAAWLAARFAAAGRPVRRDVVEAAALLHDADKLLPAGDPARSLPHGDGSAAWVTRLGHEELAPAIAGHPVVRLASPGWAADWLVHAGPEERIVAYADKRAGQRLEPMAARFDSWDLRYPGGWPGEIPGLARRNADQLEAEVCAAAGTKPDGVRRVPWTGHALRLARERAGYAVLLRDRSGSRPGAAAP